MKEKLTLEDCKRALDTAEREIKEWKKTELEVYKLLKQVFKEKTDEFLNGGIKFVKIKLNNKVAYALIDDISLDIWNDSNEVSISTLKTKGLFIVTDNNGYYNATDNCLFKSSKVFTFFDEIEDITIEDFNKVVDEWYKNTENEYLNPNNEGLPEDEWIEPEPNWFVYNNYNYVFSKHKNTINNQLINNKFEENIN